ncbi:MAG: hypothetical protein ACFN9G_01770 [Cardiobacterium sp.]
MSALFLMERALALPLGHQPVNIGKSIFQTLNFRDFATGGKGAASSPGADRNCVKYRACHFPETYDRIFPFIT